MLLIFGSRPRMSVINVVRFICAVCGVDAQQRVVETGNAFTLFFIPLFTFSRRYHVECGNCGAITDLTKEQAQHSLEWAARQPGAARGDVRG